MIEVYEERLRWFQEAREREEARGLRLGWARLVVFLLAFSSYVGADVTEGRLSVGLTAGMILAIVVFLGLVVWHRRVRGRRRWAETMIRVNQDSVARVRRDWTALPPSAMEPPDGSHPNALDLDVCGSASLFRLLSTVTLPPGVATLRSWMLAPAPSGEIPSRQEAVGELAPMLEVRQTLEGRGRLLESPSPEATERFLRWAESEPWLSRHPWVMVASWVLPLFTALLMVLSFSGVLEGQWWLLSLSGGLALGYGLRKEIHPHLDGATAGQEKFGRYAALLSLLVDTTVEARELIRLKEAILSSPVGAERELRLLDRRLGWADVRENAMAHAPLQALLVWDVHVLASLEKWKARSGPYVRAWLDVLGELEALSALAALKADNPDWVFPSILEGEGPSFEARELGHPLLESDRCVRNDLAVGPDGTFLFLTGSNMSGKSTLLRALGLNAVLAQAGGPVCAAEASLTPLRVQTSMRKADSLAEGVSQYMAELNRIRGVVDAARDGNGPAVLYLLDEPLQGTNEAERRVAVQTILGHLLDAGAIGAVATHDLRLDQTDRLLDAARAVHLEGSVREDGGGPLLSFDYKLKAGRATSTNALALLRAVGLGESGEDPEGGGR